MVASQGACARLIRRAAGPGMRLVTQNPGEIQVLPGFQLPCTHVIHTYCAKWNNGNGEPVGTIFREKIHCSFRHLRTDLNNYEFLLYKARGKLL